MELLYSKFNRHRRSPFQIATSIFRDPNGPWIVKQALTPEAVAHIGSLRDNHALIRRQLRSERLRLPELEALDERALRFEFIAGHSLDRLLWDAFQDRDTARFMALLAEYVELLQTAFITNAQAVFSSAMQEVFGLQSAADLAGLGPFLEPALADPVFENILVQDKRYFLIDQEWVFEGCLPVSFLLFRGLFYFYEKHRSFGVETWLPRADVLKRMGVTPDVEKKYRAMDDRFQAYVFGRERCYRYKDRYVKYAHSVPSLQQTIEHQREVVRQYHDEIERLRQVIAAMENSRGWKFAQKTGRMVDARFPPGTRRRRVLESMLRRCQACL
jgi:O-antigen biosynthesis protein